MQSTSASLLSAFLLLCITKIQCFLQNSTGNIVKCKKEYLYGPKGVISSPGYPDSYSNHTSCSWHISGKPGDIITVSFDDLDIEEDIPCDVPPCCNENWLKIGPTLNLSGIKYCGQKGFKPQPFFSVNSRIWIKFHISNVAKGGRGFQLSYIINSKKAKYCEKDEFHCADSTCIFNKWQCNHYNECKDGSDEMFCKDECPPTFLPCLSGRQCYPTAKHCDALADCSDFSDELDCTHCGKNKIRCGLHSTQCFDLTKEKCNRVTECENGEDERGCRGCGHEISCSSGRGCYSADQRCDGLAHCSDHSDEKDCGAELCRSGRGGFLCSSGRCVAETHKCDRIDHCGDSSDEHHCIRNGVVSAAVMGSLVCGLLLAVAAGCLRRLHALRLAERRATRLFSEIGQPEPPPSYARVVGACCPPPTSRRLGRPGPRPDSPAPLHGGSSPSPVAGQVPKEEDGPEEDADSAGDDHRPLVNNEL